MTDDNTTQPMLETLLEGQRHLAEQVTELISTLSAISQKQNEFAAQLDAFAEKQDAFAEKQDAFVEKQDAFVEKQDAFAEKQDAFAEKQDAFAARQDALEAGLIALTREVRDGFDEYNRRVDALNKRLLSFETWLSRIDDRLHDEIVARPR